MFNFMLETKKNVLIINWVFSHDTWLFRVIGNDEDSFYIIKTPKAKNYVSDKLITIRGTRNLLLLLAFFASLLKIRWSRVPTVRLSAYTFKWVAHFEVFLFRASYICQKSKKKLKQIHCEPFFLTVHSPSSLYFS